MSGGSFDYLCDELDGGPLPKVLRCLRSMAQWCETDDLPELARHLRSIAGQVADVQVLLSSQGLYEITRAVEWHASCDIGRETMLKTLREHGFYAPIGDTP